MPLTETLAPMTWLFCSGTADRIYSLLLKTAILDEATPSSVQRSEAYSGPDDPIAGRKTKGHPLPIVIDRELEWEVEEILDSHWHRRRFQYLIKWKGYGREHNSWESASEVSVPELTAEFHRKHPGAPRHIRHTEFNSIFHSESIASRRSNLEGRVNVREHLHSYP